MVVENCRAEHRHRWGGEIRWKSGKSLIENSPARGGSGLRRIFIGFSSSLLSLVYEVVVDEGLIALCELYEHVTTFTEV